MRDSPFIDRLIPRAVLGLGPEQARQGRRLALASLGAVPILSILLVNNRISFSDNSQTAVLLFATSSLLATLVTLHLRPSISLVVHWLLGSLSASVFALSWLQGGFVLHILIWIIAIPSILAHDRFAREVIFWSVVNSASAAALFWCQSQGLTPAPLAPESRNGLVNLLCLQAFLLILSIGYHRSSRHVEAQKEALERRLERVRRFESIGRLAGGVAHGFNNVLTVVLTYARLLRFELPKGDPRAEDLQQIEEAAQRGAEMARKLLAFSRHELGSPETVDVNALLRDAAELLSRVKRDDILLDLAQTPRPHFVRVDKTLLSQALMTLAANAFDAMPQGGTLTLSVALADLQQPTSLRYGALPAGRFVLISVVDTGVGIKEELLEHLFEPFTTTKDKARSAGLGLATAFSVAVGAGGLIDVRSNNQGSTFDIYLLEVEPDPLPEQERAAASLRSHADILLVDDEEGIRRALARVLKAEGYAVELASNGIEALALMKGRAAPFDLLLTDMLMPGMAGVEVAREARKAHPDLPVIFMSGYTDALLSEVNLDPRIDRSLQKPFTDLSLITAIEELIEQRRSKNSV